MKLRKYLPGMEGKLIKIGFRQSRKPLGENMGGKKPSGFIFADTLTPENVDALIELYGMKQILMKYPSIDPDLDIDEIIILKGDRAGRFWSVEEYRKTVAKGHDPLKRGRRKRNTSLG